MIRVKVADDKVDRGHVALQRPTSSIPPAWPWGRAALTGAVGDPAWNHKPSWYLVATDDRMIPPAAQRTMAARAGAVVVVLVHS